MLLGLEHKYGVSLEELIYRLVIIITNTTLLLILNMDTVIVRSFFLTVYGLFVFRHLRSKGSDVQFL